jgi:hypothetical protein
MKFEKVLNGVIRVNLSNGGFIETQSVEANLLFAIYNKLEEIRSELIDIESNQEFNADLLFL